jgi:hypothetical protein
VRGPSWWQYVGGLDADSGWAREFAAAVEQESELPARHRKFYVAAIKRLAAQTYPRPAHRPADPVNFWLACHYRLGMVLNAPKAAANDTAQVAAAAGIAAGHDYKSVQRHARKLKRPVAEFLSAIVNQVPKDWPSELPPRAIHRGLMRWVESKVRELA